MGLALQVGILAELQELDQEGFDYFREQFALINQVLKANGLPEHQEPVDVEADQSFSCDMFGYSGLHYLRRIAAHLANERELPPPGDDKVADDPVLQKHYSLVETETPHIPFQHLIYHSDAEGFYLPIYFKDVIFPDAAFEIAGGMIGSSQALLEECTKLAESLQLPTDLVLESNIVWEAADSQGEGNSRWERYGIESYTCLALIKACNASIKSGAAIVFT